MCFQKTQEKELLLPPSACQQPDFLEAVTEETYFPNVYSCWFVIVAANRSVIVMWLLLYIHYPTALLHVCVLCRVFGLKCYTASSFFFVLLRNVPASQNLQWFYLNFRDIFFCSYICEECHQYLIEILLPLFSGQHGHVNNINQSIKWNVLSFCVLSLVSFMDVL